MLKTFISGLLLGSLLTLLGGLLVGPTVTLGSIATGEVGHGRYEFRAEEWNGQTRYSVLDTETGVATFTTDDGRTIVVKADSGEQK